MPSSLRSGRRLEEEEEEAISVSGSDIVTDQTIKDLRRDLKESRKRNKALAAGQDELKKQIEQLMAAQERVVIALPAEIAGPETCGALTTPLPAPQPTADPLRVSPPPTNAARRTGDWVEATRAEQLPSWGRAIIEGMQNMQVGMQAIELSRPLPGENDTPAVAQSQPIEEPMPAWAAAIINKMGAMQMALSRLSPPTMSTEEHRSEPDRLDKFISRTANTAGLARFGGDPMEWLAFEAQYKQSTALCGLSGVENQARLRNALHGKALAAVGSLIYEADQTEEIMVALKEAFGSPHAIVSAAIGMIDRTPIMSPQTRPSELLTFAQIAKNTANILRQCPASDVTERALLRRLTAKMPPYMCQFWVEWGLRIEAATGVKSEPSLREFARWCSEARDRANRSGCHEIETEHRERRPRPIVAYTMTDEEMFEQPPRAEPASPAAPAAAAGNTASAARRLAGTPREARNQCALCQKRHNLATCPDFVAQDNDGRYATAKRLKMCFRCLQPWLKGHACQGKCAKCTRNHHVQLHADYGVVANA